MKNTREKIILKTSIISILINVLLASFKAFIGMLANSIAVISDAINNLSDALSSIITIIGTKLANKTPDKKHPYGYGRIEYMTSFIVSTIVLYAGITALIESVKKIFNPSTTSYNTFTIIILVVGIIAKFVLGIYVKKTGKKVNSDSLVASGTDAFNDGILSISVLLSIIIYMIFKIDIEAYVGVILSLFISKSGLELIKESISSIIGNRVDSSLSKKIKKEVTSIDEVLGAFDLVLANYGPSKYLGSIHIEVKDNMTASKIDKISRKITKTVYEKFGVTLHTIGVYSINTRDKKLMEMQKNIRSIVFSHKGILQMHGLYIDIEDKSISFDIIIDFSVKNRESIYRLIYEQIEKEYKDYKISIALDADISD